MDRLCDQVLSSSPLTHIQKNDAAADDDDAVELNPDQDHNYLTNVDETTSSTILKVKVIRLETELRKKENERKAVEDELLETKLTLTMQQKRKLQVSPSSSYLPQRRKM